MKNTHSNKFFKTNCGELAEEIHDKNGIKIGKQIICNAYPSIIERLIKHDNTIIYRLKVEEINSEQYIFDFSPTAYLLNSNKIKRQLAKKAIFPVTGMEGRLNAYLKQSAECIRHVMDEKPWYPLPGGLPD